MVDWQMTILRLNNAGYTCGMIAARVGSNQQHIARLARLEVEQPKFLVGVKILDLYHDVVGDFEQIRIAA